MKILILTGDCIRHFAFASVVLEKFNKAKIVIEKKGYKDPINEILEKNYFKDLKLSENKILTMVEKGEINNDSTIEKIKLFNPDICLVFGTSLLSKSIFTIPRLGCINIHTGLVQYYRGVDSNLWAIYNKDFDKIGVTVHRINSGIDKGEILLQDRFTPQREDTVETIFFKSCKKGFDILVENLNSILYNRLDPNNTKPTGKLYQNKDMSDAVREVARKNLNEYKSRIS